MKTRVLILLALTLAGAVCFAFGGYWANVLASGATESQRDRAEYLAACWLIAFGICAGAWIWVLVKTVRNRSEEQP